MSPLTPSGDREISPPYDALGEMPCPSIPPERIVRLSGFGLSSSADGYLYRPTGIDGIRDIFKLACECGRKVVLRGAGRSYGDAAIGAEQIVMDLTRMNRILAWDPRVGQIEAEPGVTIEQLWRHTLEDGWWPPVVSGTMLTTLGGGLAMNIHGKNSFRAGTLGEHVIELDALLPTGQLKRLTPKDALFYVLVSGAGLFGVIVRVKLQMKRVFSGQVSVLARSCSGWAEQFAAFEEFEQGADYMVSWVDGFARGKAAGRGLFHAASYIHESGEAPASLRPENQDLPETILGFFPKATVWRVLRHFNNRLGMRFLNAAKYQASKRLGDGRTQQQSLVGFSFLLDYVPNWIHAYLPGGLIQYQCFVPREKARGVFSRLIEMQQAAKLETFLAVMKRHKPDRFLLSHALDGFSLAQDFKVTGKNRARLWAVCHKMNDVVLQAGGRFYLAKDSTLRPEDFRAYLGVEALRKLRAHKAQCDPEGLLSSALSERLRMFEP